MSLDFRKYVQNCLVCQHYKPEAKKPLGKLQQTLVTKSWEMHGVDIMGPFPKCSQLNSYLLVFVDSYSRWGELFPLQKATALSI